MTNAFGRWRLGALALRWRLSALALAAVATIATVSPDGAAARMTAGNWDRPAQRAVIRVGLMVNLVPHNFGGSQPLTGAQATGSLTALASLLAGSPSWGPATQVAIRPVQAPTVTVAGFDSLLVNVVGLGAVAAHVQAATNAAGLAPPAYFGTEVVARVLGLRYTHPVGSEQLSLYPTDPITRAEAAWSLAQLSSSGSWSVASARASLASFQLPAMSSAQRTALRIAVSRIGYPYIWGGTTDDTSDGLAHGGFDCSGFVWRVFKLSGLSWGTQILGRTAAQMAGEIPRRQRLRYSRLRPGDLLFFGGAGLHGAATEASIVHEGIYLGDNWVINSDGQGVSVQQLKGGWLGREFAWGRRVLPAPAAGTTGPSSGPTPPQPGPGGGTPSSGSPQSGSPGGTSQSGPGGVASPPPASGGGVGLGP